MSFFERKNRVVFVWPWSFQPVRYTVIFLGCHPEKKNCLNLRHVRRAVLLGVLRHYLCIRPGSPCSNEPNRGPAGRNQIRTSPGRALESDVFRRRNARETSGCPSRQFRYITRTSLRPRGPPVECRTSDERAVL